MSKIGQEIIAALREGLEVLGLGHPLETHFSVRYYAVPAYFLEFDESASTKTRVHETKSSRASNPPTDRGRQDYFQTKWPVKRPAMKARGTAIRTRSDQARTMTGESTTS